MLGSRPCKEQHLEGRRDSPHPTARELLIGGAVCNYIYYIIILKQTADEGNEKNSVSY